MPIVLEYSIKTNWCKSMTQSCGFKVSDNIYFVIILSYDWIVVLKYYIICSNQNLVLNCLDILLFLI